MELFLYVELFEMELFICIKMDLALNNLQRLIHHKTETNNQPTFLNVQKEIFRNVTFSFAIQKRVNFTHSFYFLFYFFY